MSRSLLVICFVLCAAVVVASEPAIAPAPRAIPITELARQLGDADLDKREAATKRLSAMAMDPPHEVLAAAKSDDPEIRWRATEVVEAMRRNAVAARIRRGERFAEQRRLDLFVAATAAWDLKPNDNLLWQPAWDLGQLLLEKNNRLVAKLATKNDAIVRRTIQDCPSAFPDLAFYRKYCNPRFTRVDGLYACSDPQLETPPILFRNEAIHAGGVVSPKGLHNAIIVSRGGVETGTAIQNSVVFANGDVTAVTGLYDVVIVCDGDVNLLQGNIRGAVIVARGNITVKGGAGHADIFAGGKVILGKNPVNRPWNYNAIKENDSNPLEPVMHLWAW